MDREEVSALHSSELEKLGSDPKDPGDAQPSDPYPEGAAG